MLNIPILQYDNYLTISTAVFSACIKQFGFVFTDLPFMAPYSGLKCEIRAVVGNVSYSISYLYTTTQLIIRTM